jgi:hypothetical protein
MSLQPDTWRIDDTPDGYTLRWRPPLSSCLAPLPSFTQILPDWLFSRWGGLGWFLAVMILGVCVERFSGLSSPPGMWPLGVGTVLSCLLVFVQIYAFAEHALNQEQSASVRDGCVETHTGVFPVECLRSLRLSSKRARPGRALLKFQGTAIAEADLVSSPGLSQQAAQELLEAIKAMLPEAGSSRVDDARTKQCSGLAMKSVGMDNPLVASR